MQEESCHATNQQLCKLNPFSPWPSRKRFGPLSSSWLLSLPCCPAFPKTTGQVLRGHARTQAWLPRSQYTAQITQLRYTGGGGPGPHPVGTVSTPCDRGTSATLSPTTTLVLTAISQGGTELPDHPEGQQEFIPQNRGSLEGQLTLGVKVEISSRVKSLEFPA